MALEQHRYVAFIPVRHLGVAQAFYCDILGLPLTHVDGFAVVVNAHGTTLRLTQVPELRPQPFTVGGWVVPDIESAVGTLVSRGVEFLRYAGIDQGDAGIWRTPSGESVAWFADPDGNTLSLTELVEDR